MAKNITFKNLNANATTTLVSGPGTLVAVNINTKGAASNVMDIYDNTAGSGTKIAHFDTTIQPQSFYLECSFAVGLTVVIGTGTAADVTLTYVAG